MSKYQPLGDFLVRQADQEFTLTFAEIEEILGFPLPASQTNYAWWSNNPDNNVMTKVWLDAGFRVRNTRMAEREVTFYRAPPPPAAAGQVAGGDDEGSVRLSDLPPVAAGVLAVLARRSGRTRADEALTILVEALR